MTLRLTAEAPVRPSEDEENVRRAILNLFPDLGLKREGDRLAGEGTSLARFGEILKRCRIRDAARGQLLHGKRGDGCTVFRLNKQAAFMEKVSFSEAGAPLGDILVRLEADNLDSVIDQLAPDTRPLSMRLAEAKGAPGGASAGRPRVHIRERLDPKELRGKDLDEEE